MTIIKPEFSVAEILAWQALVAGNASADQQKMVVSTLMSDLCRIWSDDTDVCAGEREMGHYNGRRFVGVEINTIVTQPGPLADARKREAKSTTATKRPKT